jgi:aminoglycoside phosphotransferase family enzyme/predicted kinase
MTHALRRTDGGPDEAAGQDAVFAFLADAATHGGEPVTRIDTHAAAVFLAGDTVYKVKRAVRFPFLDYSTLEKRKAACETEIAVNAPFAPQLYKEVVPIIRDANGRLAIGGHNKGDQGGPVEWALVMRRFDATQTLDHLAGAGKINAQLADALGRAVADAHAKLPDTDADAWIDYLPTIVAQNDEDLRQSPALFPPDAVKALRRDTEAALAKLRPLLAARGKAGTVRRCHGDLHLGNIALIDGKPVLFDAIEFDPLFAAGDLFYDLAFLLMDMVERDLRDQAAIVLNRYLRARRNDDDLDALATLPLFLSLRAAIRAKVTAAKRQDDKDADAARSYFALAQRVLAPPAPQLIAVGGLSGTGKSVLAAQLAAHVLPEPGAVVIRSDVERKALFGKAETEKLPPDAYGPDATARVYARVAQAAGRALRAGHSVIADAVYARAHEREAIAAVARKAGVAFHGLFLTADLSVRIARVGARKADASDADATVAQRQEGYDLGALDWAQVDAGGTPADTLRRATGTLRR